MEQHGGADADCHTVDRGNDRLDVMGEGIKKLDGAVGAVGAVGADGAVGAVCRVGVGGALFEEVVEVVAGGEDARAAGDDEAADGRIILRGVDRIAHDAIHVLGDGVLFFRPSQRNHPRRAFIGDYQVSGHGNVPETSGQKTPLASLPAVAYIIRRAAQTAGAGFSTVTE